MVCIYQAGDVVEIAYYSMTMDHYEEVLALWRRCDGIGLSSADEPEAIAAYLKRNPGMSFVAIHGGGVVGAILAGHDGRHGFIHHLAVDESVRKGGVGRRLVQAGLEALKGAGIQKSHIFLFKTNEQGLKFWEKMDWKPREDLMVVSKII